MQIKIGLIGCGAWGQAILQELFLMEVSIKIVDTDNVLCNELVATYPQLKIANIEDLQYTDGIIVASPSATHRSVLEQIMAWEIPIYVEKPLTTSLKDADALRDIVHGKVFMMHIWRYHAGIQLLGEIARNKEIGDVTALYTHRCNWTSPRIDTDSVWNLAPHDLSIVLEILGNIPNPKAVCIEWHNGTARGMTALLGNNPSVQIEVSNRHIDKRREVRLHATEGVAVLADEKVNYIDIYHGNDASTPSVVQHERRYFDATPPLRRELCTFIDYLKGGPSPVSNFDEGFLTIVLLSQLEEMASI